jgi:hypothetical protein
MPMRSAVSTMSRASPKSARSSTTIDATSPSVRIRISSASVRVGA